MKPYISRMLVERLFLELKINKAAKVVKYNPFCLSARQIELLQEQLIYMRKYLYVLNIRIAEENNVLRK